MNQEDVDALTRLLQEHIDSFPERRIYWSREIYIDAGFDKDKCTLIMIHSDNVVFVPSEDPVEHPGVVVRYKHEIDQKRFDAAVEQYRDLHPYKRFVTQLTVINNDLVRYVRNNLKKN